jgi:hypothetical protein
MARDLTSGFIDEIDAKQLHVEIFVKMFFDSGTAFAWTGYGPKTWNGDLYQGVGDLASFGRMEESSVVKATGTVMVLSGVKSSLISLALTESYQGRKAEIYFAVLDSSGSVIADPYQIFGGRMDVMEIEDNGQTATISVTVENELIDLFRPRTRNYTPEDQKQHYPGDLGLDFIPFIQDAEVVWKDKS